MGEEEEEEDTFQLTDDQTADFKDAFKKFDAGGEGEIPTSELGTVMKMLGHKLNDEELEECIKMVDADADQTGSDVISLCVISASSIDDGKKFRRQDSRVISGLPDGRTDGKPV